MDYPEKNSGYVYQALNPGYQTIPSVQIELSQRRVYRLKCEHMLPSSGHCIKTTGVLMQIFAPNEAPNQA